MNADDTIQIQSRPPKKVDIACFQRELDLLWESFHQNLSDGQAITRACMSNLIIYCDNHEQREAIEKAVPFIVQTHPARVIFLIGQGTTSKSGIEVMISGHYCALPSGWQVCAEQICVLANPEFSRRLPSVTRAQLVGDLPTTLWWASLQPPPFAGKLFFKLADMSDQIIYDSIGWTNPTKGMQAMSRWVTAERSEYIIFNLAWRRLKPWRNLLSQVLDPVVQPGALAHVSRLTIEHGPHALAMALLLLGWLASRLNWKIVDAKTLASKEMLCNFNVAGRPVPVTLKRLPEGKPTPYHLHWYWRDHMTKHHVVFSRLSDERLGIIENDSDIPARVIAAPELKPSELVSAQLAHRTRDKLFEQALVAGNDITSVINN